MAVLFWFRRDLRLEDNHGLYKALTSGERVIPLFIFDKAILGHLEDKHDRRLDFIHQSLESINMALRGFDSSLLVKIGDPIAVIKEIVASHQIKALYTNHDYEPYAKRRDEEVKVFLESNGINFYSFKDQCIFEGKEICKEDGKPYTVFTPYSKKWKTTLSLKPIQTFSSNKHLSAFVKLKQTDFPSLQELGFHKTDIRFESPSADKQLIEHYHETRNLPYLKGTSRLSIHLRFGTISIRKLVNEFKTLNEVFLNELIWRDFYFMILDQFPYVANGAFKKEYNRIEWENNEEQFVKWCEGKTGYPMVDAGMRELNETGFMHNRSRMITASFLVKHLLIDWRWGEAYFAKKLNDFDLSANNGGWQWAASSGCDAAPYFRIFNPEEQQKKFDPEFTYIKKWVKEFGNHQYPSPIVEHKWARSRALNTYKKAISGINS